jgi:hypothetical protein
LYLVLCMISVGTRRRDFAKLEIPVSSQSIGNAAAGGAAEIPTDDKHATMPFPHCRSKTKPVGIRGTRFAIQGRFQGHLQSRSASMRGSFVSGQL